MTQPQALPFFGRAWQVSVDTSDGTFAVSSADDADPLRVCFTVEKYMLLAYWKADISIYNMNQSTAQTVGASAPTFADFLACE
ncbi:MAG TPA: hypothetical protein VN736_29130 [Candidatus Limnocylindrales bacterium]|nr:hypothetical protein [Candidatus Limnocylindrales bacterium]